MSIREIRQCDICKKDIEWDYWYSITLHWGILKPNDKTIECCSRKCIEKVWDKWDERKKRTDEHLKKYPNQAGY